MRSQLIGLGLVSAMCSITAFAEPAVQPGETLESLSKARVNTTVNGQPGSLNEMMNSGQYRAISQPGNVGTAMPANRGNYTSGPESMTHMPPADGQPTLNHQNRSNMNMGGMSDMDGTGSMPGTGSMGGGTGGAEGNLGR